MSKHGEELGKMNAELIKALQANRDKRRAEREERESIDSQLLPTTSYYSECECGQVLEGEGEYDPADGTLYGNDCNSCGAEFIVSGWFEQCDFCDEFHPEEEHKEEREGSNE